MPYPYFPMYQQPYQLPQQPPQNNGDGFIHVPHESVAREWSLSPGQSKTFINDNAPYCYTKSMPISQLEPPIFKRFRLVEEPDSAQIVPETASAPAGIDLSAYISKAEFEPFCATLEAVKAEIENLKKKPAPKKKEAIENE